MIRIAAAVIVLTIIRYTMAVRKTRSFAPLEAIAWAILGGLAGGVPMAIAARGGMAAITILNGGIPRFTMAGTSRVLFTFIGIGGALAIAYAGLFGGAMSRRGFAFGAILVAIMVWPVALDVAQTPTPPLPLTVVVPLTTFVLALMWFPWALIVERVVAALQSPAP